jgi:excisionase family DNA binding protein
MMGEYLERLYTVKEVAKYLRISKSHAYLLIQKKKLPYIRVSQRRIVVRECDLKKWIERRIEKPEQVTFLQQIK